MPIPTKLLLHDHFTMLRQLFQSPRRRLKHELKRLRDLPRYQPGCSNLTPKPMRYVDAASWAAQYEEIWEREIYLLPEPESVLRILDCGANIGTASTYFHHRYPNANILAFEADPIVFSTLQANCDAWDADRVERFNLAVWTHESKSLKFASEGADSGAVIQDDQPASLGQVIEVSAVPLVDYLDRTVDLLKMDIEYAELTVLESCEAALANVRNLFVEHHSFVDQPQSLDRLLALLKRAGFRCHLDTPAPARQPLIAIEPFNGMDQYTNVYAVRG